jgi:hypothetical protein
VVSWIVMSWSFGRYIRGHLDGEMMVCQRRSNFGHGHLHLTLVAGHQVRAEARERRRVAVLEERGADPTSSGAVTTP